MKVAIDGPAGAGKSTIARLLAERLDYVYIDTGAMYRALTLLVLRHQVDPNHEDRVVGLLEGCDVLLKRVGSEQRVYLNDEDVSEAIRTPEVSAHVSYVAQWPRVRKEMLERQRDLARQQDTVMDGRDIGTHVLPDAEIKVFLTASVEERARRRIRDLEEQGYRPDMKEMIHEIEKRDRIDSERETAPLKQAPDAVFLDTTEQSIQEVVQQIVILWENRKGK